MNKRSLPLIGITTYGRNTEDRYHLPAEYVSAVRAADGLPVLLPPGETNITDILLSLDGLIFAGGGDIDPSRYNGNNHPEIKRVDPERDQFEFALAEAVLESELPVLGICRGQQLLNIATGGTLIEHLPDQYGEKVIHRRENGKDIDHDVSVAAESRLAEIVSAQAISTKSMHHQGIGKIGDNWNVAAVSEDGVVEAQEHCLHPWMVAVQWHPEMAVEQPAQLALFRALVAEANRYREKNK